MERPVATIHRMVEVLLPFVRQLAPVDPLRLLHRALPYRAALRAVVPGRMRITIELELRITLQRGDAAPENVVGVAEPLEPAEADIDIPAVENMIQGIPAPHAPLRGSLYGILDHYDP